MSEELIVVTSEDIEPVTDEVIVQESVEIITEAPSDSDIDTAKQEFYREKMLEAQRLGQFDTAQYYRSLYLETAETAPKREITELPGYGSVEITGDPYKISEILDDDQGDTDEYPEVQGDCGLVSVVNILRMAGKDVTEAEMIKTAISNNLCSYSRFAPSGENGGTDANVRAELLRMYGIECDVINDKNGAGSIEAIAQKIEEGYGVNISVNGGKLWNQLSAVGNGQSNHSIIVTGTVRDPDTHELLGLTVCDSGLPEESGANFVSVQQLNDCYVNTPGTAAVITSDPIR